MLLMSSKMCKSRKCFYCNHTDLHVLLQANFYFFLANFELLISNNQVNFYCLASTFCFRMKKNIYSKFRIMFKLILDISCLLSSPFCTGNWPTAREQPHLLLKDACKSDMTAMDMDIEWWEDVANIRSGWRDDLQQWLEREGIRNRDFSPG